MSVTKYNQRCAKSQKAKDRGGSLKLRRELFLVLLNQRTAALVTELS